MRRSLLITVGVWLFACADSDLFGREGEQRVSNDVGGMAGSPDSGSGSGSGDQEGHGDKEKGKDEGGAGGAPGSSSASSAATTGVGGEPPEREYDDDD